MHDTVIKRLWAHFSEHQSSTLGRLLLVIAVAVVVQVIVTLIRRISVGITNKIHARKDPPGLARHQPKFITLIQLISNAVTFAIYFFAFGLILQEFGVNLTAYLASASIVGLAISFGSQGMVQDIVIGLTLIFSDAMDVGDMVAVFGVTNVIGRVEEIGLRFTKIIDFYNQEVFIPNRTIANVSRFPHGGIDAYADVQIPIDADQEKAVQAIESVAGGMWTQFSQIILSNPVVGGVETAQGGGWKFLRVYFKIWPGQGSLIETTFCQHVVSAMKQFDPNYAPWQVPVTYRASTSPKQTVITPPPASPPPAAP
jgi:moderate conductance mechanosensitive channel